MRSPGAAFDLRAALMRELGAALEELDTEAAGARAVHRCRVRLKRARALARIGKTVAPGLSRVFNDSARTVMRQLGAARDLSALAETARAVAKKARPKTGEALRTAADALDAAHHARPHIAFEPVRAGVRDLQALAQVWPEPSARQIRSGAKRLAKRARRAWLLAGGTNGAPLRHEWRKCEKDRLYAASLLGDVWPGRRRRKSGDALTRLLGKERDALLLINWLTADVSMTTEEEALNRSLRALRRYGARLRARANKIGARLHADGA